MRINILLPDIVRAPAGGHKVIYEYSNRLVEDGHQVTLCFFPGNIFSKFHLYEPIRLWLAKLYGQMIGPAEWFKLDKRIKKQVVFDAKELCDADVVIATGICTAQPVYKLPSEKGKKVYFIQDFENWEYTDDEVFESYSYGMCDIAVSQWLKDIVDAHSAYPCHLVSNGINTQIFKPMNLPRVKHSIAFHYRSGEYKGGKYALETISLLAKRYDDLVVYVVSSEVKQPELLPCCKYLFNISADEVARINNSAEVFMCSSVSEGYGLPGLEAMACGAALATTEYAGSKEYAIDRENALLSRVKDSVAMAENITALFEDEELRSQISATGVKTGIEHSLDKSYVVFKQILCNL